ncbi:MAG TPA: hypothetical protein VEF89_03950 [Solirubrobacteraceae bacterium]|nr:hypothetical protein [Solirubrobacteraceae bacterium]
MVHTTLAALFSFTETGLLTVPTPDATFLPVVVLTQVVLVS